MCNEQSDDGETTPLQVFSLSEVGDFYQRMNRNNPEALKNIRNQKDLRDNLIQVVAGSLRDTDFLAYLALYARRHGVVVVPDGQEVLWAKHLVDRVLSEPSVDFSQ